LGDGGLPVRVKDLVKIYKYKGGEVQALRGITASFPPGKVSCIMGPSGSGKTTLLNLIGGIDVPTGGEILVGDVKVHELSGDALDGFRLKYVGFIFQALNLVPTLSAIENVELPLMISGVKSKEAREKALHLLDLVGVKDKASRYPEELSGGEQQRVAIAIALANDPPVILADEPTAELDSVNALNIVKLLVNLAKELGKTIILATHDPRVAVKVDRILRIEDGKITGEFRPIDLERGATSPGSSGLPQVKLSELIKMRLSMVEEEMNDLEERFRSGEIGVEEFHNKLTKLKAKQEALKDLLTSLGTS